MRRDIQRWEGEGGATSGRTSAAAPSLRGTPGQIEWAQRIRATVNAEFNRVAKALASAATTRSAEVQRETEAVIGMLEEKRAEVLRNEEAGYFIHEWQETGGRVRKMIMEDGRYAAIRARRGEACGRRG